jgi:hypothetical protein
MRLSRISATDRIGIVSTLPEFLQTMMTEVISYGPPAEPPLCAVFGQEERIRDMMTKVNMVIYASGSEPILRWLPKDIEAVEFLHSPDLHSVNRLRALIE